MGRQIDESKWRGWAKRFERFERQDTTVVAFCEMEEVSVASFYQWRAKLRERGVPATSGPAFREVAVELGKPESVATLRMPSGAELELRDHPATRELLRWALTESGTC